MTVANYEKGLGKPSTHTLSLFAEIYRRPINWFLEDAPTLVGVRYRALKSVNLKERSKFEADGYRWLIAYRRLESQLGEDRRTPVRIPIAPDSSGREAAEVVRKSLDLRGEPIVSVIDLLEQFGVYVIEVDSEARIDAFAAGLEDDRVVVLNSRLSNDRVRLNALHELGHLIFEDYKADESDESEACEKRAFEFASHMLIPSAQLRSAFDGFSMVRLVEFKQRFGVSLAAMIYRAQEERIIPASISQKLWMEFAKRGWRKNEPGKVMPDRPKRLEQLIEKARTEHEWGWAKLATITSIGEADLQSKVLRAIGS